ncbi:MAG: hypothetical protein QW046_01105 [Candidatus Micrarchaeaceae archaeon]
MNIVASKNKMGSGRGQSCGKEPHASLRIGCDMREKIVEVI